MTKGKTRILTAPTEIPFPWFDAFGKRPCYLID